MNRTCLALTILALPFGAPAFASAQLANILDMDDGTVSSADMATVYAADLGDADILGDQIVSGDVEVQDTITMTPGRAQIAALTGEDPTEATLLELAAAQLDVDPPLETEPFGAGQGKAQLARELDVSPQTYSLAELVEMKFDAE
ncbi:MAG: hypothetical protein AAFV31_06615 [Pseudomonadota bacterium]